MTNEELIAKIKAEIERKKEQNLKGENSYYDVNDIKNAGICRHRRFLCEELLSFLSTLESEKPNDPDERWDELQTNFREINEAFEEGKKEQREQMMKEAVDGEVIIYGGLWQFYAPDLDIVLRKLDEGDKVKIIIVKE